MRVLALLLVALCAATPLSAQPAPFHKYRTLDTPHFHVTVPIGLEREGRVAGAAAERAYALLAKELRPPRGMVDLVVTDDADYSNGYATPIPTNRIVVFAAPPVESNSLRLNEDWLQLVITHELTHIFHLDRVGGVWALAQHIFGRGPALFPNSYGPSWLTEGLAVYYESRLTQGGRLKDSEHEMLARTAAAEHRLPFLKDLSLGTPIFPGGERAYAFGSLFVQYLSDKYGDSSVARFVNAQSSALIPFTLDRDARSAFGVNLDFAFGAWRDSVQRETLVLEPPFNGWRELTKYGYNAESPRWTSDSTLIYAGSDGRSTAGEFTLDLGGTRHRIGRRNSLGPNVRLPDGDLLFSQIDYETNDIVRADLYVEHNGKQKRLTHGLRLVQPDARADGTIVAVQLDATRASLLLLSPYTLDKRLLRSADPDETWSEPRWSPDGHSIAVAHRAHGGVFSIEVISVASAEASVVDRARVLLSAPTWQSNSTLAWITEASGTPAPVRAQLTDPSKRETLSPLGATSGLYALDYSPSLSQLAGITLRADGYHVGVAPARPAGTLSASPLLSESLQDSQPLQAGNYHAYHAWRSLLPQYWYPLIEDAPGGSTRLGFTTSGRDILYRHIYDGYLAIPTTGSYPTGRLTYRYAGFRKPYVDAQLSQDYFLERTLMNGGTTQVVGSLLRRSQVGTLGLTFTRPRARTSTSFSFGASAERRTYDTDPGEFFKQINDTIYHRTLFLPNVYMSAGFSNLQRPALSISPEDGISASLTVRQQWQSDAPSVTRSYSVVGVSSVYKSLDLPGFAHHVIALRAAGGAADRKTASTFFVGGTSGTTIQLVPGYDVGNGRRTFGVRGFEAGAIYGTDVATGTFEYRLPVTLTGTGIGALPFFFDRTSISGFVDAGTASCVSNPRLSIACAPAGRIGQTIASAGAELLTSAAILDYDTPQNIRLGFAVPFVSRTLSPRALSVYVAYGMSF